MHNDSALAPARQTEFFAVSLKRALKTFHFAAMD
jgi:hypothetical protein